MIERGEVLKNVPRVLLAGAIAAVCYIAPEHSTPDEPSQPSVFQEEPSPTTHITTERKRYLASLPFVKDSEVSDFIRQERNDLDEDVQKIESLDNTTLTAGNSLSWIVKLSLEGGWNIKVSPNKEYIRRYSDNPVRSFSVFTMNALDGYEGADGQGAHLGGSGEEFDLYPPKKWKLVPVIEDNTAISSNNSSPNDLEKENKVINFSITTTRKHYERIDLDFGNNTGPKPKPELTQDDHTVAEANVKLRLPWYQQDSLLVRQVTRAEEDMIVSEFPVDEILYTKLYKKAQYYRKYMQLRKPVTVVSLNGISGGATYDQYKDIVTLPLDQTEGTTSDHENAHALLYEARDSKSSAHLAKKLEHTFNRILTYIQPEETKQWSGKDTKLDTCSPEYSGIFKTFDETTYENDICASGHPADNADELFASAFTTMKYRPDQVINSINSLPYEEQLYAIEIVRGILDITDTLAKTTKNPLMIPDGSPFRDIIEPKLMRVTTF